VSALACDDRVRIFAREYHAFDTGRDQCPGARTGPAGVSARLEADVDRRAGRLAAGCVQRLDFGVIAAGSPGKAFTDDLALADDNATDRRIRPGAGGCAAREFHGANHERMIGCLAHVSSSGSSDIWVRRARLFGLVFSRSISS
jgi:hypothetical protein